MNARGVLRVALVLAVLALNLAAPIVGARISDLGYTPVLLYVREHFGATWYFFNDRVLVDSPGGLLAIRWSLAGLIGQARLVQAGKHHVAVEFDVNASGYTFTVEHFFVFSPYMPLVKFGTVIRADRPVPENVTAAYFEYDVYMPSAPVRIGNLTIGHKYQSGDYVLDLRDLDESGVNYTVTVDNALVSVRIPVANQTLFIDPAVGVLTGSYTFKADIVNSTSFEQGEWEPPLTVETLDVPDPNMASASYGYNTVYAASGSRSFEVNASASASNGDTPNYGKIAVVWDFGDPAARVSFRYAWSVSVNLITGVGGGTANVTIYASNDTVNWVIVDSKQVASGSSTDYTFPGTVNITARYVKLYAYAYAFADTTQTSSVEVKARLLVDDLTAVAPGPQVTVYYEVYNETNATYQYVASPGGFTGRRVTLPVPTGFTPTYNTTPYTVEALNSTHYGVAFTMPPEGAVFNFTAWNPVYIEPVAEYHPYSDTVTIRFRLTDPYGNPIANATARAWVAATYKHSQYTITLPDINITLTPGEKLETTTLIGEKITLANASIQPGDAIAPHLYDVYFKGSNYNGYIYYGDILDNTGSFTILALVKPEQDDAIGLNDIFTNSRGTSWLYANWRFAIDDASGKPIVVFGDGSNYVALALSISIFGKLARLYTVYNASSDTLLLAANDTVSNSITSIERNYTTLTEVVIGNTNSFVNGNAYKGYIYFVVFYNTALESTIINTAFQQHTILEKPEFFFDPTFCNGTHYINLVNESIVGTPYGGVQRVPAEKTWLWLVKGLYSDGLVHLRFFPSGTVVRFRDPATGSVVAEYTVTGTPNQAGLVEDYTVTLPPGNYTIEAWIPRRTTIAPHLYDWKFDGVDDRILFEVPDYNLTLSGAPTTIEWEARSRMVSPGYSPNGLGDTSNGWWYQFIFLVSGAPTISLTEEHGHSDLSFRYTVARINNATSYTNVIAVGIYSNDGFTNEVWNVKHARAVVNTTSQTLEYTVTLQDGTVITRSVSAAYNWSSIPILSYRIGGYVSSTAASQGYRKPVIEMSYAWLKIDGRYVFLADPTFYNGTHYINLVNESIVGTPYGGVGRVVAESMWLWTVLGDYGGGWTVDLRFFPPGTIVRFIDAGTGQVVREVTVQGPANAAGLVEQYPVHLPPGNYTIQAYIPQGTIIAPHLYDFIVSSSDYVWYQFSGNQLFNAITTTGAITVYSEGVVQAMTNNPYPAWPKWLYIVPRYYAFGEWWDIATSSTGVYTAGGYVILANATDGTTKSLEAIANSQGRSVIVSHILGISSERHVFIKYAYANVNATAEKEFSYLIDYTTGTEKSTENTVNITGYYSVFTYDSTTNPLNLGAVNDIVRIGSPNQNLWWRLRVYYLVIRNTYDDSATPLNTAIEGAVFLADPTFFNGTHYIDLISGAVGTPYGNVSRVPADETWLWVVFGARGDGLVHLEWFPVGSVVRFIDYYSGSVVREVVVGSRDDVLYVPPGRYRVEAVIANGTFTEYNVTVGSDGWGSLTIQLPSEDAVVTVQVEHAGNPAGVRFITFKVTGVQVNITWGVPPSVEVQYGSQVDPAPAVHAWYTIDGAPAPFNYTYTKPPVNAVGPWTVNATVDLGAWGSMTFDYVINITAKNGRYGVFTLEPRVVSGFTVQRGAYSDRVRFIVTDTVVRVYVDPGLGLRPAEVRVDGVPVVYVWNSAEGYVEFTVPSSVVEVYFVSSPVSVTATLPTEITGIPEPSSAGTGILAIALFLGVWIILSRNMALGQSLLVASAISMIVAAVLYPGNMHLIGVFMVFAVLGITLWKTGK